MTFVFDFSWDDCYTREKLETTAMPKFLGVNCIMVYVKMGNYCLENTVLRTREIITFFIIRIKIGNLMKLSR